MTTTSARIVEIKVERTIPAPPGEVFDAWLDPKVPGTLWHEHDELIFNPKVDGLWYLLSLAHRPEGTPHYGRFTEINRPGRIRHSWMSRNTLGEETMVAVTFQRKGQSTLMTLVHSGLPEGDMAKAHEKGWNSILDKFGSAFVSGSHRTVRGPH
jgi:uncharacterized protein YndB with AHSA1/START domain